MGKKYIAPTIITALFVIYNFIIIIGAIFFGLLAAVPWWGVALIIVVPAGTAALILYMLIQRIREIQGGEEDEASKY